MLDDHLPNPVFPLLVGSGRSGTTLVRAILNSHSRLAITMEAGFLARAVKRRSRFEIEAGAFDAEGFGRFVTNNPNWQKMAVSQSLVTNALTSSPVSSVVEASRAIFAAYAREHGKALYGDKTPAYVKDIESLASAFPEAKFVHIIRDGRDAAVAYLARGFGPQSVGEVAAFWRRNIHLGRTAGRRIGANRYIEVRYEDVLHDAPAETRRLCDFLGLDYQPAMLEYWNQPDSVLAVQPSMEIHESAARPPTKGLRDWRTDLTPEQIGIFQAIAGSTLAELGYPADPEAVTASIRIKALREQATWQWRRISARASRRRSRR